MQKTALTLTVSTLVIGIFGAFLRWLQTMNAFEQETGFPIPGAGTTIAFVIYSVVAAAAFCVVTFVWLSRFDGGRDAARALRCPNAVPLVLGWVFCAALAAASVLVLFTAAQHSRPGLQRFFGAFGILAAVSIPMLFGKKGGSGAGPFGRGGAIVITLFCCCWLLLFYTENSNDPVIWNFAPEILALAASAVAFYHVATYFFGTGRSGRALLSAELAVYFNVASIFDARSTATNVLVIVTAATLLLVEYLLIANMTEKPAEEYARTE